MMHKWCVAFDFDGTLLDPRFISLFRTLKEKIGLSPEDVAQIDGLLERFLGPALVGETSAEDEAEWILTELEVFIRHGLSPLAVAPLVVAFEMRRGALECLDWLKTRDVPVSIVSFGIKPFIRMVLAAYDALDLVDEVYALQLRLDPVSGLYSGYDDSTLVLPSNKGEWAIRFAGKHGIAPERILGVGDSLADRGLGLSPENRFGFAPDEERRLGMMRYFGEVAVTGDFYPAFEWIKRKLKSG